jgi:hypothetical protein
MAAPRTLGRYAKGSLAGAFQAQYSWRALGIGKTMDAERFSRDALALHPRLLRLWHLFRSVPAQGTGPLHGSMLMWKRAGVEPTNNSAERVFRWAVRWRNISFGSHSPEAKSPGAAAHCYPHLPNTESKIAQLPRHRDPITSQGATLSLVA